MSSAEYLNYALENRREWASKGEEVLAQYIEKHQATKPKEEESKTSEGASSPLKAAKTTGSSSSETVTTETSDSS